MIALVAGAGLGLLGLPGLLRILGRGMRPDHWSKLCIAALACGSMLVTGAAMVTPSSMVLLALGFPDAARTCESMLGALVSDSPVSGAIALAIAASSLVFGARALLASRRTSRRSWVGAELGERLPRSGPFEVVVLQGAKPAAWSVRGAGQHSGQMLLSTGLLAILSPSELAVVIAHGEAHLRLGHSRYLALCAAVERAMWFFPPARVSARALRLALERWADEEAVGREPKSRSRLATALLAVGAEAARPSLAAFSSLDGLLERVAAWRQPTSVRPSPDSSGRCCSSRASSSEPRRSTALRLGQGAYCYLSMSHGCLLR